LGIAENTVSGRRFGRLALYDLGRERVRKKGQAATISALAYDGRSARIARRPVLSRSGRLLYDRALPDAFSLRAMQQPNGEGPDPHHCR
jgi:hypothetical protein